MQSAESTYVRAGSSTYVPILPRQLATYIPIAVMRRRLRPRHLRRAKVGLGAAMQWVSLLNPTPPLTASSTSYKLPLHPKKGPRILIGPARYRYKIRRRTELHTFINLVNKTCNFSVLRAHGVIDNLSLHSKPSSPALRRFWHCGFYTYFF